MSRNGSGAYTVPNSFTAGQPIVAADHNENWSDMASEMSNSVAADGQTSMTGPLKCSSGSLALPSQSFASDTNTGRYRKAADTMADVCGGTEIVEISSTGIDVTGSVNADTVKQGGFALMPVGIVAPFAGPTAPDGWLLCYGQAVSRTTYAALYNVLGGQHGSGDGSTTFNLPDLRGRVAAGQDDMGGVSANRLTGVTDSVDGDTFAASGGAETQVMETANLPAYTPAGTITNGSITISGGTLGGTISRNAGASTDFTVPGTATAISASQAASTFAGTAQGGTSTPFSIVQPTLILNYIIYAGV